jgi:hypothetical protein
MSGNDVKQQQVIEYQSGINDSNTKSQSRNLGVLE